MQSLKTNDIYEDEFILIFNKRTDPLSFKEMIRNQDINYSAFKTLNILFVKFGMLPDINYN